MIQFAEGFACGVLAALIWRGWPIILAVVLIVAGGLAR